MGKGHHSCGVAVCRNTSVNAKKRGLVIHFFRFPQEPDVKKIWILKCNRADKKFNPNNARICSEHFRSDDYVDSLKARLMGETPLKLKKCAVPTLLLHPSKQNRHSTRKLCKKNIKETTGLILVDESCKEESLPISESSNLFHLNGQVKSLEEEVLNINRKLEESEEPERQKKRLVTRANVFKRSCDEELERRVTQFFISKVQILVAEIL